MEITRGILILNLCILLVKIEANDDGQVDALLAGSVQNGTESKNNTAPSTSGTSPQTQTKTSTTVPSPTTNATITDPPNANMTNSTGSPNSTIVAVRTATMAATTPAPAQAPAKIQVDEVCSANSEKTQENCKTVCDKLKKYMNQENTDVDLLISLLFSIPLFLAIIFVGAGNVYCYTRRKWIYKDVSAPSRPRRAAEPLDILAEGAIDPVMSPAVDEFDVEGAPIAQKGKFDKNSQDVRLKHRQYMQFMKRQEKSDADSRKFKKQPPIFIPAFVDDAQFAKKCEDPDNIILDNVVYDPSGNELYEIGSDVDNIELNPSSILTLTEDSQKASTMKTMKAPKTPVTSATQLKTAQPAKSMANAKSSKKSARKPKPAQQPQQQPQPQAPAKSLVEKSFLV